MKPITFFFLAGFCLILLTACQEPDDANPPANQTPTQVALLQTATPSLTVTRPPTITQSPTTTFTPSQIPTATRTPFHTSTPVPPTLTPTPFPDILLTPDAPLADVAYRLADWSPEQANRQALFIREYERFIEGHFYSAASETIYYSSFVHEARVYQEALLRYPEDPQALKWRLGMITNLAISWDKSAERLYRELIVDALNRGEIPLEGNALRNWFHTYPSDYEITAEAIPPPLGYASSHIVSILSGYSIGGSIFWLLETADGFTSYPIQNNLGAVFASETNSYLTDITNDGMLDLVIYEGFHNGTSIGGQISVYDLSQVPPIRLSFGPKPSGFFSISRNIHFVTDETGTFYLQVLSYDPSLCSAGFLATFAWNGQWFEQTQLEISYEAGSNDWHCLLLLNNRGWVQLSDIDRAAILDLRATEFLDVRPVGRDWRTGEAYLPDAKDEFRYLTAMSYALLGQNAESIDYLTRIINTPTITNSQWIEPAQTFLAHYETAEDIYPACKAVGDYCDWRSALERTVASLLLTSYESYLTDLAELDVTVLAYGIFDFDTDSAPEQWFIVRHLPGTEAELWVLAQSDSGLKAMFVNTVQSFNPTFLFYNNKEELTDNHPNGFVPFTIGTDDIYVFIRRLRDNEPYITKSENRESWSYEPTPLSTITTALLNGADPAQSVIALNELASEGDFEPSSAYYYYLGLAYELSGDETNALNAYLQAWQACCDTWNIFEEITLISPYAMLARGRVELVP
jgi:hypothetical protein